MGAGTSLGAGVVGAPPAASAMPLGRAADDCGAARRAAEGRLRR